MAGEIYVCKAPDPLVFRVSGFGSFLLAKRTESEDEYLALFGTISMIGNGIEILYYEKMKSKMMHKVIKDFEESQNMPICIDSNVDELKKYLFGAFAFGLSKGFLEKTDKVMNAFEMLGGFANEKEWLDNLVNNDSLFKSELANLINKYGPLQSEKGEEVVATEFKLEVAPKEVGIITGGLLESGHFIMTNDTKGKSVIDLVKPADPELVEQLADYLDSGKVGNMLKKELEAEELGLSTLIISGDGKEMYKEIAELSLGKNGKVEITAKTISGASAALGQLIKVGVHNIIFESARYQHWKDLL